MVDFDNPDAPQQTEVGKGERVYEEDELRPGGSGKQGDQQQMGQIREPRKDKSHDSGDSDKQHAP